MFPRTLRLTALLPLAAFALAACTVGPDYVKPDTAVPDRFARAESEAGSIALPRTLIVDLR